MSFREKSAWITLVTVLVVFSAYFGALLSGHVRGFHSLYLLLVCGIGLVVLQVGLNLVAVATTPRDGRAPRDERETLIQWRSHTLGYYVLMVLVLVGAFGPIHFGHSALDMANFALFAVVIATLAVALAQIVMFRRGA
jgi:xanthine/uracil permease